MGILLPGAKMLDLRNILSYTSFPEKENHSELSNSNQLGFAFIQSHVEKKDLINPTISDT